MGTNSIWSCEIDGGTERVRSCSDLAQPVDARGYLHGDFGSVWSGPSRAILIAVAQHAAEITAAFGALLEREAEALDSARADVASAVASA